MFGLLLYVDVIATTTASGTVELTNPLSSDKPLVILGKVINTVLGVVGSLALVAFLYGGFMWLISGGNSERVSQGLKSMLYAGIGIIVVFSSYAIITLILKSLGATQ